MLAAAPCARKEARLLLTAFLLLPPARMRGECRFHRMQVTAGDLVVLPRGDTWPQLPMGAHRAGVQGKWSCPHPLAEHFLASLLAKVGASYVIFVNEESANVAVGCFRKRPSRTLP